MDIVAQFVEHLSMKELAAYLARGRRFAELSDRDLNRGWIAAFRVVYYRYERQVDLEDLGTEFLMRGLEPPFSAVEDKMKLFREELAGMSNEEAWATNPVFRQKLREFLAERNKPSN